MPRGDKPTTVALALKDGWVYEDTLPASITKEEYDWWFKESLVLDGVRMGPPLATKPQSTTETLEPCPNSECQSDKVAASNDFANYYVYCPDCFLRGPRESVDHFGARWNALARISPASAAPVVDNLQRRLYEECVTANWDPERRNTLAEEIAHLHEELSEAFRAWRKYKDCEVREVNGKLEGVPIEFADALIGMFYNAELYGFDLLATVERKHKYNLKRNYVKEGRQLHAPAAAEIDEIVREIRDVPATAAATAAPVEQSDEYTEISCAGCGRDTDTKLLLCPTCVDSGYEEAR